jgi:hypothetical protein
MKTSRKGVEKLGFIVIPNLTELEESEKRLFRKHRQNIDAERLIRGVYFIPIRFDATDKERLQKFYDLLNELRIPAEYFLAYKFSPKKEFQLLDEWLREELKRELQTKKK